MPTSAALALTVAVVWGAPAARAAAFPSISAGGFHSCAVKTSGTLNCWGGNGFGQAGVPSDLGKVTEVSAGEFDSCAVKTDGTVSCWGLNSSGQTSVPPDLGTVTKVSTGILHACAVKTNDTLSCWGSNGDGQLDAPSGLGTVVGVSAGGDHTCAVKTSGNLSCWGWNGSGEADVPSDLGTVTEVSAGYNHTCAVKTNGTVRCWGLDDSGQAGVPSDLGTVTEVSAGYAHTCAVKSNGTLACWGLNDFGQTSIPADLGRVTEVSAGYAHTCAVKTNGTLACWGWNGNGQTSVPPGDFPSLSRALFDDGDPTGLDFGDLTAGLRSPVLKSIVAAKPVVAGVPLTLSTVTLSNTGGGAFQILSQSCTSGQVIADGTGCALRVRFTPRIWQRGDVTGLITVTDDSVAGSHTVPLTGTALRPAAFILQNATAAPATGKVEFAWETSDDSKVTITIAQPVTTTVKVKHGRKTATKKITKIKQLALAANLSKPAAADTFSWNRMIGKAAAAKGTWAWNLTAKSARGTATATGTVTLA